MKKVLVILCITAFAFLSCGGGAGGSFSAGQSEGVQDLYNPDEPVKPEGSDIASGAGTDNGGSSEVKDTSAPFITNAKALSNFVIRIDFSEDIKESVAKTVANYSFKANDETISAKSVEAKSKYVEVTLVSTTKEGVEYNAIVRNVEDLSGNAIDIAEYKFTGKGAIAGVIDFGTITDKNGNTVTINTNGSTSTSATDFTFGVSGDGITAYQYLLDDGTWSAEIPVGTDTTLTGLSDGLHTLQVIVKNSDGVWQEYSEATIITWTVDTAAPTSTEVLANITSPNGINLNGGIWNQDFINIQLGDGIVAYQYELNGTWISGTGNLITIQDLDDGTYNVNIKVQDAAGNWSEVIPAVTNFTIDTTNPVAIITNINTPAIYNYNDISFVIDGNDNIQAIKWILDGGTEHVINIPAGLTPEEINTLLTITLNDLSATDHTLSIAIQDNAGNWSEPNVYNFTVDMTAPATSSVVLNTSILPTLSNSDKITLDLTGSAGEVAYYKYLLDDGTTWSAPIPVSSTWEITGLSNGGHTIQIIGIDLAGNESLPISHTWTVDTTPMTTSQIASAVQLPSTIKNGTTNINSASIIISGTDIESFKYLKADGTWSEEIPAGTLDLTNLPEGLNTLTIIVKDTAGNWTEIADAYSISWIVDTIKPNNIVASMVPPTITGDDSISIGISNPEAQGITEFRYQLDNGTWSEWMSASEIVDKTGLSNQLHTLSIQARDLAGNESEVVTYSWTVDTDLPTAVAVNIPASVTNSNSITIDLSTADLAYYRYKLDNGSYSDWILITEAITINNLTEGAHTIEILGKDAAGNIQATPTVYNWTVDTIAPVITLTSDLTQNPTNIQTNNITVNGSGINSYTYRVDSGVEVTKTSINDKIVVTGSANGLHSVTVTAKDLAGNVSLPVTYNWTVDITPPSAPAAVDTGAMSNSANLTANWANAADVADIKIQVATDAAFTNIVYGINGGATLGKVSTYQFTANDTYGDTYYFRVKAADALGNWSGFGTASDGIKVVGSVTGTVMNTSKEFISGANVSLNPLFGGGSVLTTTTNASGVFTIPNVGIGINRYRAVITKTGLNGAEKNNITVSVGETVSTGTLYLVSPSAPSGNISGSVINANDGTAVTGYTIKVTAWDETIKVNKTYTTSAFTTPTPALASGSYTVEITKTGYYPIKFDNIIVNGNIALDRLAICETLQQGQVRVIIQWGATPEDLELYMTGPTNKSVTTDGSPYSRFLLGWVDNGVTIDGVKQKNLYSFDENTGKHFFGGDPSGLKSTASKVRDDYDGYGPEAINLFMGYKLGTYIYTVRDWYGGNINNSANWAGTKITARVYYAGGMQNEAVFTPVSNTNSYLKMMQINVNGYNKADVTVKLVPAAYQQNTMLVNTKASMNWSAAGSGITTYLLAIATDYTKSFGMLFILVFISFMSLYMVNRRRHKITQK